MKGLEKIKEYDKCNLRSNCGIYYLLKDDVVVYIGQTILLNKRPLTHPDKEYAKNFMAVEEGIIQM